MTNEEKSKEIARECVYCFADAENGALKMAEWKDKQFNEFKNKVKNFLNECDKFHMYKNAGWPDELENEILKYL